MGSGQEDINPVDLGPIHFAHRLPRGVPGLGMPGAGCWPRCLVLPRIGWAYPTKVSRSRALRPAPVLVRQRFASVGKRCMGIRAFKALRPGVAFGWPGIKPGPGWGTGLLPRLLPAAARGYARGILGMGDLPHDVPGM